MIVLDGALCVVVARERNSGCRGPSVGGAQEEEERDFFLIG